jgi:hypothetical protein
LMYVRANIANMVDLEVLVDSGASGNYISKRLV